MRQLLGVAALLACVASSSADVAEAAKNLKSEDITVRRLAAEQLSEAGAAAKPALDALIKALAKDDDRYVRTYAAKAIGNLGADAKKAMPTLVAALDDSAGNVRSAAIQALAGLGEAAIAPLGQAALKGSSDLKQPATAALAKLGKPAYAALVDIVKEPKVEATYRRVALAGLMKLGDDAKPAVKVFTDVAKNPRMLGGGQEGQQLRLELFRALGSLATKSDAEAVKLLDGLAKEEKGNAQVKKAAADALKRIQGR